MRFTPHICKSRHDVYYFRFVVPERLRHALGKAEIRRSLGTHDPREALRLAANLSAEIEELLRAMGTRKPKPGFHDIRHLLIKDGDRVFEVEGFKADPTNPVEQQIIEALQTKISEFGKESGKAVTSSKGKTLSWLIDAYCTEQNARKKWTSKTGEETRNTLEMLGQVIGKSTPLVDIDRDAIKGFREVLVSLPPNISKRVEFKGKSLSEIANGSTGQKISDTTVKKHLQRVSGLFAWATVEGHIVRNPAQRLAPKVGERARDQRSPFSDEDIRRIFGQPTFAVGVGKDLPKPFKYWVPLIALYSGTRIEEICQLHLADIKQTGSGTWYFDINESEEDKRIKTGRGRHVPIHGKLIELGLLRLVEAHKKDRKERLFPELKKQRDGYSQAASRWFGRFLRNEVGIADRKKVFHCFRHTVASKLQEKGVAQERIAAVLGHSDEKNMTARYAKSFTADQLREEIEKLDFSIP